MKFLGENNELNSQSRSNKIVAMLTSWFSAVCLGLSEEVQQITAIINDSVMTKFRWERLIKPSTFTLYHTYQHGELILLHSYMVMRGLDCQQTKIKSLQVLFKYKLILRTITGLRYFSLLYAFVVDTIAATTLGF